MARPSNAEPVDTDDPNAPSTATNAATAPNVHDRSLTDDDEFDRVLREFTVRPGVDQHLAHALFAVGVAILPALVYHTVFGIDLLRDASAQAIGGSAAATAVVLLFGACRALAHAQLVRIMRTSDSLFGDSAGFVGGGGGGGGARKANALAKARRAKQRRAFHASAAYGMCYNGLLYLLGVALLGRVVLNGIVPDTANMALALVGAATFARANAAAALRNIEKHGKQR